MKFADTMNLMRQCWPFNSKTDRVLEGYQVLGRQHALTLADIALRNGLFASLPPDADAIALARAEGRREAALEIFALSNTDAGALFALIETKPSPQRSQS